MQSLAKRGTAPVGNSVDTAYQRVQFDGSFMTENIFRKDGSPEVDEAWEALGIDCESTLLTASAMSRK